MDLDGEIILIITLRFKEIVLLMVLDEWQQSTLLWWRALYYLMCIDRCRMFLCA